ncbi:MAG: PfkB domain protein [Marmoricola sp.]|nr:PfkB domain protein [Marmoricola sp.]
MIVVVGESLIDLAPGPDGRPTESVGGSPLNVAVALARLEANTMLITEIGSDERADQVVAYLRANEVEFIGAPAPEARTPTATVHVDAGDPVYDLDLRWHLPHQELPHCDALHIGSLATVLEPGRDSVLDLVEQAWALDVFVSYDPNVRANGPHFWLTDHDHDQAWGDIESLADRANLVKVSEQDIELLHPGADPDSVARSLLTGDRTELVILTRGARGATAYAEGVEAAVPGIEVEVVDTVGAGDAFMAAVLAVLLETDAFGNYGPGLPADTARLESLLTAAVEVAGFSCAQRGAGSPRRADLRADWPE